MTTSRRSHEYTECGLRVTLEDIELRHCESCGESEVVIPRIDELHGVIALNLSSRRTDYTEAELTFLRRYLGSSAECGRVAPTLGEAAAMRFRLNGSQSACRAVHIRRIDLARRGRWTRLRFGLGGTEQAATWLAVWR